MPAGGYCGRSCARVGTIFGTNVSRGECRPASHRAKRHTLGDQQVVGGVVADLGKSVGGSLAWFGRRACAAARSERLPAGDNLGRSPDSAKRKCEVAVTARAARREVPGMLRRADADVRHGDLGNGNDQGLSLWSGTAAGAGGRGSLPPHCPRITSIRRPGSVCSLPAWFGKIPLMSAVAVNAAAWWMVGQFLERQIQVGKNTRPVAAIARRKGSGFVNVTFVLRNMFDLGKPT